MFGNRPTGPVDQDGASIGMAVGYASAKYRRRRPRCPGGLLDNLVAILWMHRSVAIAMENDGRHGNFAIRNCLEAASLPHGYERGGKIARGAAREA